ncbi:hypothetical protein GIB67_034588 [Kingdonia uniflora]|uniref:KIB1-4 beta-propeller domain-containing protein n=1 Tax=Kingdonia uniflora TaxID=39325 RepID=A0A7J7MXM7_9MAGN|nr:hypothetical protein GIB67_034588 [Kingdonia uniflora]
MSAFYLEKVILSGNPTNNNYIAMAICGDVRNLAFSRSGDKKWTLIKENGEHTAFEDVIYLKDQFYVVDGAARVLLCNIDDHPSMELLADSPLREDTSDGKYLVDVGGKLKLVFCQRDLDENVKVGLYTSYKTSGFKIYSLDLKTKKWSKSKSLGDYALFVGRNSFPISTSEITSYKRDCIYFTDDYYAGPCHEIGIYSLKDRCVKSLPFGEVSTFPGPVWVAP